LDLSQLFWGGLLRSTGHKAEGSVVSDQSSGGKEQR
jgi:hypothetical protein